MTITTNWATFPLVPGTKKPAPSAHGWQHLKPSVVPMTPPTNHGTVLNADDLVLDVDPRNGGTETIKGIWEQHAMPQTRAVSTPSGGLHLYYRKSPFIQVRVKQKLFPGVDFLSQGQFTCGPGTYTRESENSSEGYYKLVDDSPIAELPESLLKLLEPPPSAVTQGAEETLTYFDQYVIECKTWAPAIQGQQGDKTTLDMAHRGRDLGLPPDVVYQVMRDHFNERCKPRWKETDLYKKVENAFKYARGAAGQATPEAVFMNFAPPAPPPAKPTAEATDNVVSVKEFQADKEDAGTFMTGLILDKHDNPTDAFANVVYFLKHDPAWRGRLKYNQFANTLEFVQRPRWREDQLNTGHEVNDEDLARIRNWFSASGHVRLEVTEAKIYAAMVSAAAPYHPVKDYLNPLVWDGIPRLDRILIDTAGADDDAYTREVGRIILIAAVKRIYEPGCKQDYIAVLEGRQGTGKSAWIEALGGKWYSTNELVRGDKDTFQKLRGKWIIELPEINATFSRADHNWMKGIISTSVDNYRPSYGRATVSVPRESIFLASINPNSSREYLKDDENRRYLPIKTGKLDLELLRHNRDQYFAEAVARYRAGEQAWIQDPHVEAMARSAQEERREKEPWVDELRTWVNQHANGFTPLEARQALGLDPAHIKSHQRARLYATLKELGCEHTGEGTGIWVKKQFSWEDLK